MVIRTAIAQMNPTVGAIDQNARAISGLIEEAAAQGAQVIAFPELVVTGYPPEDLLLKPTFIAANQRVLENIASRTGDILAVVGFVDADPDHLYNAAALCHQGSVLAVYHKQLLPNYGVFDERRYFEAGTEEILVDTPSGVLGVCVCEDAWSTDGPVVSQGDAGAQAIVNINGSPYHQGKLSERTELLAARARRARASIVYVNMVGGQDELVFDGGSLVLDPRGDRGSATAIRGVTRARRRTSGRDLGGPWLRAPHPSRSGSSAHHETTAHHSHPRCRARKRYTVRSSSDFATTSSRTDLEKL